MSSKFRYTLLTTDGDDNEIEIPVTVEYDYSPPRKRTREYPGGPPIEPDEGDEVEVCTVTDQSGKELKLTKEQEERVYEACCVDINNVQHERAEAAAEDHAEYLRELYEEADRKGY